MHACQQAQPHETAAAARAAQTLKTLYGISHKHQSHFLLHFRSKNTLHPVRMSLLSCISGLETMSLGGGDIAAQADSGWSPMLDGFCITERAAPVADAVRQIGDLDGLRVTLHFLFMNLGLYRPPLVSDELLHLLTCGLVERVVDGRLDEGRAAELALGRATILLTLGAALPLTPAAADRVYGLIHEKEKCVYFGE